MKKTKTDLEIMKSACDQIGVNYGIFIDKIENKTDKHSGEGVTNLVIGWSQASLTKKTIESLCNEDSDQVILEFNEAGKLTGY